MLFHNYSVSSINDCGIFLNSAGFKMVAFLVHPPPLAAVISDDSVC